MSEVKQVIVVRKDLNMRKGKIAAQVAHASMAVLLDSMQRDELTYPVGTGITDGMRLSLLLDKGSPAYEWVNGPFTKIVASVNSLDELLELQIKANAMAIRNAVIIDAGRTEFHGEPTVTCIAIGPHWSDKIDEITGDLPLL